MTAHSAVVILIKRDSKLIILVTCTHGTASTWLSAYSLQDYCYSFADLIQRPHDSYGAEFVCAAEMDDDRKAVLLGSLLERQYTRLARLAPHRVEDRPADTSSPRRATSEDAAIVQRAMRSVSSGVGCRNNVHNTPIQQALDTVIHSKTAIQIQCKVYLILWPLRCIARAHLRSRDRQALGQLKRPARAARDNSLARVKSRAHRYSGDRTGLRANRRDLLHRESRCERALALLLHAVARQGTGIRRAASRDRVLPRSSQPSNNSSSSAIATRLASTHSKVPL